jgi:putative ABC transport system permease protein
MEIGSQIRRLIRNLLRKQQMEHQLDDEVRAYIDMAADEKVASGISPEKARRLALAEFGGVEQVKQAVREQRAGVGIEALGQDLRYALRQLRKSPSFTVVAVLTLALGIGANTAIYSIIHGALQLSYANADRMVVIKNVYPRQSYYAISWPDFLEVRRRSKSFTQVTGVFGGLATWRGGEEPESLRTSLVTDGYFRMYGMQPILGRGFLASDHRPGSAPVCVLAEDFWREQLRSDASLIGKLLDLDDNACTIVGVMPRMVPANHPTQVWIPMEPNPPFRAHDSDFIRTVALLRPRVSEAVALAELCSIQAQINKQFPDSAHDVGLQALSQNVFGDLRSILYILLAAVGFILLISCVNLANMLLARGATRAREFAIRRALGASLGRMMRQTLTESLLLSASGTLVGLVVAAVLTHIPIAAWPKGFLPPSAVHLDGRVLAFTTLLALATGVFFGLIPTLHILRQDERSALQQGHTVTDSREHNRTRSILVVLEIALSMLLVAGSLDMAFYFTRLMRTDPGVNPQNVLSLAVSTNSARYSNPESKWRFYHSLLEKLALLPGVSHVAATTDPPFWGSFPIRKFSYDGKPNGTADGDLLAGFHYVTPGYLATVQTPLLQGRDFSSQDGPDSPGVVIINRGMAQKLWPGQSAVGKSIRADGVDLAVIGIAADVRFAGPAQPAGYAIYRSIEQDPPSGVSVLLRTRSDPLAFVGSVRSAILSIDPDRVISNITSIEALADLTVAGQRTSTLVISILGTLALLLACIGVYGVLAYSVSRREREFGIRIALGSSRSGIFKLLFSGAFRLVIVGMILGAGLAVAMRAWVASLLGTNGTNAFALLGSALLLCVVSALATFVPARRASRIEPIEALRAE